jgi:hypothetical protein
VRAVCESCGAAQPPGWTAGELCGLCGAAVRRDVRCFWCVKWTPFARFCRSCGAETVEEVLYGAARMLKAAGTDRFTVPKMLRELDRDQIENFTRIYQRHDAVVVRHVDDVRFLERFLFQKTFSAALDAELVPELPFPDARLESLAPAPLPAGGDLATAAAIGRTTPFPLTRSLAALARLGLSDWDAYAEARAVLDAKDPHLRAEAALALSGWRVVSAIGRLRERERDIAAELERSPFRLAAAVRLGLLGRRDDGLLREALGAPDPETSFAAALALGDVDRLRSALEGDDRMRIAAGRRLVELGVLAPLARVLPAAPLEVQRALVEALGARKGPLPEVEEELLGIVEATADQRLRQRAAAALCRRLRPERAMRVALAARGDPVVVQSLLSKEADLPPAALAELGRWLVEGGRFSKSQWGLEAAAERGAIADDFVPAVFARADERTRRELVGLAEAQLKARGDEALHRFVLGVVFGPHPAETRAAALWALRRWYLREDPRGEGPFRLEPAGIERFFGSARELVPRLAAVLRDAPTLRQVGVFEFLASLFASASPAVVPALFAAEEEMHDLVRAALEAVRGDLWPYLVEAILRFLGLVGTHPRWRAEAIAGIEALEKPGNYHWEKALRTLRLSIHGLPDEPEWHALADDFVPARFAAASPEGRGLLLAVAEQQLIRRKPASLGRFLLAVAFGPFDAATRSRALALREDRAPPEPAAAAFGSLGAFLPRLAAVVRAPPSLEDPRVRDFVEAFFRDADPAALAAEDAAPDVVRALLEALGGARPREVGGAALRILRRIGGHPRWRDEAAAALRALAGAPGFDLARECGNLARELADRH